ncbi:MAG TPA: hypothetical protein VIX12_00110, partial [Candidatus Binataceae bacterium]
TSVHVTNLGMLFGLENIAFRTDYARDADSVEFDNHMEAVPEVVAPVGIHKMAMLVAGEFMRVLAQGNGGLKSWFSSRRTENGMMQYAVGATGEFDYSPTLEFLARIGDRIADAHNDEVRAEERELGEEFFNAFVSDYNAARPRILALDGTK